MTKKLIAEALQLVADLKAARDSTDDPVLKLVYQADILRVEDLLERLNKQLNNLTNEDK